MIVAVLATLFLSPATAETKTSTPNRGGIVVRVGIGAARGSVDVAEASGSQTGIAGTLQFGWSGSRWQVLFDAGVQPFRIQNPLRAEAFRVAYGLVSVQAFKGRAYVRGGVGPAWYRYSGSDVFVEKDTSVATGLTLGYEWEGSLRSGLEFYFRRGWSSDGELRSGLLGLQLVGTWYSRSP